ncbi:helix-turn-helix domain-containing protein [Pusillimonas sp. TS35]|jgi:DNA-binding IclR family transcriptional regulator|uniref:IclR family transcriptional regulator n=1 Tax=Paracandidimonas lactea TaxID=2895524 RepID=UPI00136D8E42|nr:IclR family transcriptional regulator [Paracandidimonas lactea]MYN13295.1 helix-turn-helix domain-containing protein [Pusillimonas sp. TS35]
MTYLSAIEQSSQRLEDYDGDPQFAMTLAKGLELLSAFTPDRPVLSNKELSDMLGMSKSTVSRFTYTLTRLGYMAADKHSGKFQLGTAVLSIGYPLLANIAIRQFARPMMSELAEAIQGSVSMGVLDRLRITYIETSRHRSIFNTRMSDIGLSVSLAGSAIGRAYLCGLQAPARETLLNTLKVQQPKEWEQHHKAVLKSIEDYRRYGFCMSEGEILPDVYGVGVPFHGKRDELIVFNCVVHAFQCQEGTLQNDIGPRLLSLVKNLEAFMAPFQRF